jgi:hypothetical protein
MTAATPSSDALERLAEEAYVAAVPWLENYKTLDRMVRSTRRRLNELVHNDQLLGPEFTQIVAPNNDTLYSSAWLDLSGGPLVLATAGVPDGRYWSFQLVDAWNFNFGYVGTRTTGDGPGHSLIHGPGWAGEVPPGIDRVFPSESRFVFLLGRTLVDGPKDVENVKAIQAGYRLMPLAAFLGAGAEPPALAPFDGPPWDAERARTADFVAYANWILGQAAIHPDDAERIRSFAPLGLEPGASFDAKALAPNVRDAIERGMRRGHEAIDREIRTMRQSVNGWSSLVHAHGPRSVMAHRPLANAAGAREGLYGNDKEEARNFVAYLDEFGRPLDGRAHRYALRLEPGELPPVHAFWSMTMYRLPEILLVANPIDRYSIGDRTRALRSDPDGALEILVQHMSPGAAREANWLPAPDGRFAIALRSYLPDLSRFERFRPPAVRRLDP